MQRSTGQDPDGTLSVTVDATHRVVGFEVHRADGVRSPETLEAASRRAYRSALVAQVRESSPTSPPGPRTAVATPLRGPAFDRRHYERHQIRTDEAARPRRARGQVDEVGDSDNSCVRVRLVPASSRGVIDADPGWLSQAAASQIGQSVQQAFTRAYESREQ